MRLETGIAGAPELRPLLTGGQRALCLVLLPFVAAFPAPLPEGDLARAQGLALCVGRRDRRLVHVCRLLRNVVRRIIGGCWRLGGGRGGGGLLLLGRRRGGRGRGRGT